MTHWRIVNSLQAWPSKFDRSECRRSIPSSQHLYSICRQTVGPSLNRRPKFDEWCCSLQESLLASALTNPRSTFLSLFTLPYQESHRPILITLTYQSTCCDASLCCYQECNQIVCVEILLVWSWSPNIASNRTGVIKLALWLLAKIIIAFFGLSN